MRRCVFIAGLVTTLVLGSGTPGFTEKAPRRGVQQKPDSTEVRIDNFSFEPVTLTVPVGTTVTWRNRDDIPHTVVSSDDRKAFKSRALDTDEKFSFTFDKAGNYPYFCSLHPKMTAKVIVQ